MAATSASSDTSHIRLSVFSSTVGVFFFMMRKVSQIVIIKPYCTGVICTMLTQVKYWRHPSLMGGREQLPWLQESESQCSWGVNMQDVSTLQDRLAVTLPLDTDLRSVLWFFSI